MIPVRWLPLVMFAGLATACSHKGLDADEDGFTTVTDCDDMDPHIHPSVAELCDGIDNDCDGRIDEEQSEDALIWFRDADGDGFGDYANPQAACHMPYGYVANDLDCNDRDPAFHPGAPEPDCTDNVDYNCDGSTGWLDADQDGVPACLDCSDTNETIGQGSEWYADADGDGFGGEQFTVTACEAPIGYVSNSDDCNDLNPIVFPGATEQCDGLDNNCDSIIDELVSTTFYNDTDGDGYGDPLDTILDCSAPNGYVNNDSDCNDADSTVSPASLEFCDLRDNNCDGSIDEDSAIDAPTWYMDIDKDGYGDPNSFQTACVAPPEHVADGTDCDDDEVSIHPDALDIPEDGIDQDCDGIDATPSSAAGGFLGDLSITSNVEMVAFCQLYDRIYGNLTLSNTQLTSVGSLSCLGEIHGNLTVQANSSLTTLDLPSLILLNGDLVLDTNPVLANIQLGTITEVGGSLELTSLGALTDFDDLTGLTNVQDHLLIENNISLNDVTGLHTLGQVGGDFSVIDNTALSTNNAEALRDAIGAGNIGGTITISGNAP